MSRNLRAKPTRGLQDDPYLESDRFFQTALERKDLLVAKLLQPTSEMEPEPKLAAKPLGIAMHDHLIVGKDGHASLKGLRLI